MKVLVTGGAGFVGSHLVKTLIENNLDVSVVDCFHLTYTLPIEDGFSENLKYRSSYLLRGAKLMRADMLRQEHLARVINEIAPDCIVHLAALPLVSVAERHLQEASEAILKSTINLLEIVRGSDFVKRLVLVSSSMVYGDFPSSSVTEEVVPRPINIYGGLKFATEVVTRAYLAESHVEYVIARPSGVYGPGDNNRRVVQLFCENALLGKPISIVNGRDTFIDFTWVEDLADSLFRCCTTEGIGGEVFNLTCGRARTLQELVDILRTHVPDIEVRQTAETEVGRPRRGTLEIGKAVRLLNLKATTPLEVGVTRYLAYLRRALPIGQDKTQNSNVGALHRPPVAQGLATLHG